MADSTAQNAAADLAALQRARSADLATGLSAFFQLLEQFDYERAQGFVSQLPCPRRLQMALLHVCSCETMYFAMASLNHPAALQRRLESAARELEFFLSLPTQAAATDTAGAKSSHAPPLLAASSNSKATASTGSLASMGSDTEPPRAPLDLVGSILNAFIGSVLTCRPPHEWPAALNRRLANEGESSRGLVAAKPRLGRLGEGSALGTDTRAVLAELVALLRLRRAMLPLYVELVSLHVESSQQLLRVKQLADRVHYLRSSRADALNAPGLEGLRELTLLELGALEPLLRAHALLPELQLRDALLALTAARHTIQKLRLRAAGKLPSDTPFNFNIPFVGMVGNRNAAAPVPEPNLYAFLRTLCVRLTEKASLLLHRPLAALIPQDAGGGENASMPAADGGASTGLATEATDADGIKRQISALVAKQSAASMIVAVLFDDRGLRLTTHPATGFVHTHHTNEEPGGAAAAAVATGGAASSSSRSTSTPWPPVFLAPRTAKTETTLRDLWPSIASALAERRPQQKAVASVHAAERAGVEHTFWILPLDRRVVALVVCTGSRRRLNEAPIADLLKLLATHLSQGQLVEGSLHETQQSWWPLRSSWSRGV